MIQVYKEKRIQNVTNVINEKSPSVSGIVNQECKGKLWVDNIYEPRIAIAESFATGSFAFLGTYETNEEFMNLKDFLENELFNQLKIEGYNCFEFSIDSENMRKNILEMFKDKTIQTEKEFSFRVNAIPENNQKIPNGYQIRKVDITFWNMLLEGKYENDDFIKIRLLESWHSFDEFMNSSIAYCIVLDNRIVAVMVGTASFNNAIAIDIEVEEEHRRMGLAYAMAVEFIKDCLKNGYIPQWDCVESNPNSYKLARKLGFEKMNENTVYWFDI
jgi:GNAT superfamily N-acetyltransferase